MVPPLPPRCKRIVNKDMTKLDQSIPTDLSHLKYDVDNGAPNFHVTELDIGADLLIKIVGIDNEVQGFIPCHCSFLMKYMEGPNYNEKIIYVRALHTKLCIHVFQVQM